MTLHGDIKTVWSSVSSTFEKSVNSHLDVGHLLGIFLHIYVPS